MSSQRPEGVIGKIVAIQDAAMLLMYVDEHRPAVHVKVSGKQRMVFHEYLVVGTELIIELNPADNTQGRLYRRATDLGYAD